MPKQTIKRYEHRKNGLAIDCTFPASKARGIIILLDGIPNPGNRREQSSWFARKGYAVLYPKYRGTWESDGRFLDTSPAKDIDRLLLRIVNRTLSLPQQLPKHKPIIIASSFGGSVAFSLRSIHLTKRIYCLSPVIDYKAVHGIKTLEPYLRKQYPKDIRFTSAKMKELLRNNILKPNLTLIKKTAPKWTLFIGEHDPQIDAEDLIAFAERVKCSYRILPLGHISLRDIKKPSVKRALKLV